MSRRACLLAVLALSGCDKIFGLDDLAPLPVDASADVCAGVSDSYDVEMTSAAGHRYRIVLDKNRIGVHQQMCSTDAPDGGFTHLFAPASVDQMNEMRTVLVGRGMGGTQFWVGVVQPRGAGKADSSWELITGGLLAPGMWGTIHDNSKDYPEPDDGGDYAENDEENVAELWNDLSGLVDQKQTETLGAICECDDRMVNQRVLGILNGYL